MSTATTDTGELRIYGELVSELGDVPSDVRTVAEQVLREAKAAVEWTGPASGPGAEESAAEASAQDPAAQPHTGPERQGRQRQSPAQDGAQSQPGLRRGPQQPRALQESQPSPLVNSGDTGQQRVQWGQSAPGGHGDQQGRGGQGNPQESRGGRGGQDAQDGRGVGEGAAPLAQRPPQQGVPQQQGQPGEPRSLSPRSQQDGPSTAPVDDRSEQPGHP